MKTIILDTIAAALCIAALLLAAYAGMTKDLCARIDTFSPAEQAEMRLSPETCELPIWRKL